MPTDPRLPLDWEYWPEAAKLRYQAELTAALQNRSGFAKPPSPLDLGRLVFGQAYQDGRHTRYLNDRLLDVAAGRIDRLLVTMPPRHFKSESCSHLFPAWFLANNPDKRVILATYGDDFAREWGRKARNTLNEFGSLWGVKVATDSSAADQWDIEGHRGGMKTAGIGGGITGRGSDILLIDDPIKDQAEAMSAIVRKRAYDWFQSVAYTRLAPGAKIVLIQTRWHEEDLAGRLLGNTDPGADKWHHVSFPAIAEDHDILGREPGEALFPERYSVADLERIKANLTNPFWWFALYQQKPPKEYGRVIDCDLLRGYTFQGDYYRLWSELDGGELIEVVHPGRCTRITVVDCALSSKDVDREAKGHTASWNVLTTFDITPQGHFIVREIMRGRWPFPQLLEIAQSVWQRQKPAWIGIEDAVNGRPLLQSLTLGGYNLRALTTKQEDKLSRAAQFLNRLKSRQIYIHRDAAWRKDLLDEFIGWTGSSEEQTDQIDTFAYACREWQNQGPQTIQLAGPLQGEAISGGRALGWG